MDPVSCRTSECIPLFSGGVGDKYGKSIFVVNEQSRRKESRICSALKITRAGCKCGLPVHRKKCRARTAGASVLRTAHGNGGTRGSERYKDRSGV